jgi:hypothetical protein
MLPVQSAQHSDQTVRFHVYRRPSALNHYPLATANVLQTDAVGTSNTVHIGVATLSETINFYNKVKNLLDLIN